MRRAWINVSWLVPIAAVFSFVVLYIVAASLYPGGTRGDPGRIGFSLLDNYWCDLLDRTTYGGRPNASRPCALAAMATLCAGLAVLWWVMPLLFPWGQVRAWIVRLAGIGCALVVPLVGSRFHDTAINLAGLLGAVAFVATITGVRARHFVGRHLRIAGWFVLALVASNYFVWQTRFGLPLLPVIQKLAFAVFLTWVVLLSLRVRQRVLLQAHEDPNRVGRRPQGLPR